MILNTKYITVRPFHKIK